jgi:nucleoside-diphosphate-sugar epimerase
MILVTGATGFIGSHLIGALAARGERFRCLVRRADSRLAGDVILADLESGRGLEAALCGVDVVLHLAGVTRALRASDYYTGNKRATEVLAQAVGKRNIRFVHISSLAAVGPNPTPTPLTEDTEPHPFTHYGRSKLEAEQAVRSFVPGATIIRPPVVYGPRDTGVLQLLKPLSRGWAVAMGGGERSANGGGDRWFSAIYVQDLVEGILLAVTNSRAMGRTYFLSHGKPVSWSELAATAAQIMGRSPRALRVPVPVARAVGCVAELWSRMTRRPSVLSREKIREAACLYWTCAADRAAAELGFEARTSLPDGLTQTLAWYKEAGWLRF